MTTVSREPAQGSSRFIFVVRSTDLRHDARFRDLGAALSFCRHLGLPYSVR